MACPICTKPEIDSTDVASRPVGTFTPTKPLTSCVKCYRVASAERDAKALGDEVVSGASTRRQLVTAALA